MVRTGLNQRTDGVQSVSIRTNMARTTENKKAFAPPHRRKNEGFVALPVTRQRCRVQ